MLKEGTESFIRWHKHDAARPAQGIRILKRLLCIANKTWPNEAQHEHDIKRPGFEVLTGFLMKCVKIGVDEV